jgi:hypothetical protein
VKYTGIIEEGERINNNPVWYQLANGYFVWSGGLLIGDPGMVSI